MLKFVDFCCLTEQSRCERDRRWTRYAYCGDDCLTDSCARGLRRRFYSMVLLYDILKFLNNSSDICNSPLHILLIFTMSTLYALNIKTPNEFRTRWSYTIQYLSIYEFYNVWAFNLQVRPKNNEFKQSTDNPFECWKLSLNFLWRQKLANPFQRLKGSQLNSLLDCEEFTFAFIYY